MPKAGALIVQQLYIVELGCQNPLYTSHVDQSPESENTSID
jgi:hypothetical protein